MPAWRCSARWTRSADLDRIALAQWHRSLERNLTTAFLVTRAFLPGMKRRGYGRIVNVSSTTGAVSAVAGDTAYAAAKAGMVGFTRAVALEAARFGITVNAVAPGLDRDRLADRARGRRRRAHASGPLRHVRRRWRAWWPGSRRRWRRTSRAS